MQSFSNDEPFTVEIAAGGLGSVLSSVKSTESTPPLWYYLAWLAEKPLGSGETGMRLLPALLGTLLVPATWAAARETLSERAALIAALLVTLAPLLVWYSQEARAYALFALLATLGFLFFVRALRYGRRIDLALWSLCSALALATHYFALFAIAAEGLWLLHARREQRGSVLLAALPPALVGLALVPLLRHQEENVPRAWSETATLWDQLRGSVQELAVGLRWTWWVQRPGVLAIVALAAVGAGLLLWRGSAAERRGALPAAVVGGATVLAPVLISLAGANLVTARNAIAALPLVAIVTAAGLGAERARRPGLVVLVALCAAMLAVNVARPLDERLQRDDWEELMAAAGTPSRGTAVAVLRPFENGRVAAYYLPGEASPPRRPAVPVRELVLVGDADSAQAVLVAAPAVGLTLSEEERRGRLGLWRLRSGGEPVVLASTGLFGSADLIAYRP